MLWQVVDVPVAEIYRLGQGRVAAGRSPRTREYLTALDAAIGDADHGINMDRGIQARAGEAGRGAGRHDAGALLKTVGMTLVSTVGGASGPLYGTLFLRMGSVGGRASLSYRDDWAAALAAGVAGVQRGARPSSATRR